MWSMRALLKCAVVPLGLAVLASCGDPAAPAARRSAAPNPFISGTADGFSDVGGSPCSGDAVLCGQPEARIDAGLMEVGGIAGRRCVTGTIVVTGTDSRGGQVFSRFKTWPSGLMTFDLPMGTYTFVGREGSSGPYSCKGVAPVVVTDPRSRPGIEVLCNVK